MLSTRLDERGEAARACGLSRAQLLHLRSLLEQRARCAWEFGDCLVAAYGRPPRGGRHDGAYQLLEALADELGCSLAWLSALRITSAAWPLPERRPSVSWSVHRELAGRPDRVRLLDTFVEHCHRSHVTPSTVRLRAFVASTSPTTTARGHVDPVTKVYRQALRLDRDELVALIERLSEALALASAA